MKVCSSRWCAGASCSVTSDTMPSAPRPTLVMLNRSGYLSRDTVMVPSAGVISFMLTTISSTGGMLAPVPCALTCTRHGVHELGLVELQCHRPEAACRMAINM